MLKILLQKFLSFSSNSSLTASKLVLITKYLSFNLFESILKVVVLPYCLGILILYKINISYCVLQRYIKFAGKGVVNNDLPKFIFFCLETIIPCQIKTILSLLKTKIFYSLNVNITI